jgi:hypothetical protein
LSSARLPTPSLPLSFSLSLSLSPPSIPLSLSYSLSRSLLILVLPLIFVPLLLVPSVLRSSKCEKLFATTSVIGGKSKATRKCRCTSRRRAALACMTPVSVDQFGDNRSSANAYDQDLIRAP